MAARAADTVAEAASFDAFDSGSGTLAACPTKA
jgi:hypothetical protein